MLDAQEKGSPAVEYLLKETSFSTCDNRFFGELEKEMLIPNNVNIYGRIRGATGLKGYKLRLEFPAESSIGYIKQPVSNSVDGDKRVLVYGLESLLNFDDYWWLPLADETEFSLALNLLPPFPDLNPVDLQISCRPDIAGGLKADVVTRIRIEAGEQIDNIFLRLSAPPAYPGVSMALTNFSGDRLEGPRPSLTVPDKLFPFPRLSLAKGQALEYSVTTSLAADPSSMIGLKCQQDVLGTRLILMSDSSPSSPPCSVKLLDPMNREVQVEKTIRSTILQASAQIMYSPFTIRNETRRPRAEEPIPA